MNGASVPGLRYIQVSYDVDDRGAPMDYTLTLKTNGKAGVGAPEYKRVDGLVPPKGDSSLVDAAAKADTSERAETKEDSRSFPVLIVALGVALLVVAAGAAYLIRRGGRGSAR